jgi:hypothetical protein
MHGRLRVDVTKGKAPFVLVHDVCGNLARDDAAKEAILFSHIDSTTILSCDERRVMNYGRARKQ